MKNIFILLLLLVPLISLGQATTLRSQQTDSLNRESPYFLILNYLDTPVNGANIYRIFVAKPSGLKWNVSQIRGFDSTVVSLGDNRYAQLLGAYSNPAFVNSLSAGKVFGLSSVATSGNYSDLTGLPNLSLYYLNSNPSGYINGITSGMVTAALSFTPYNSSNPSSYITSSALSPYQLLLNGTGFVKASGTTISYDNSTYLTSVPAQSFASLTGKPTTIAGYGITDPIVLTSGSYANPAWITSLAYSKLTGTPTIPAQANITGGTGITIGGSYPNVSVTNSLPDQTVSITAGQNTKVTGTYPSFTISDSLTMRTYNSAGLVNQPMKMWCDTVTPSTSNGYSINISSAGFTRILSAHVIGIRSGATASTGPNSFINSMSTTALVVSSIEDNPSTVNILGNLILLGAPSVFSNVTGLKYSVTVVGY